MFFKSWKFQLLEVRIPMLLYWKYILALKLLGFNDLMVCSALTEKTTQESDQMNQVSSLRNRKKNKEKL